MTPVREKRSRLVTRHLKCDTDSPICYHCKQAGIDCDRSFNVRFREGLGLNNDHDIVFPERGIWPHPIGPLQFHDETTAIKELYCVDSSDTSFHPNGSLDSLYDSSFKAPAGLYPSPDQFELPVSEPPSGPRSSTSPSTPHLYSEDLLLNILSLDALIWRISTNRVFGNGTASQTQGIPLYHGNDRGPSFPSSPNRNMHESRSADAQNTSFSEREAALIRNYVDNMALWADITDPQRHFEIEVPLRALEEPVLRYAIFAFSSRHIDRQRQKDISEALQYHNRCLQLLIPVLSGPRNSITDTVLAAVAILRQHEEMDCEDNQFHLTGTTQILNTVSSFGSSGGLGEAAAWLCLREDIYISLISQRPLQTDLCRFKNSNVFCREDDFAWASRMVFLLAKVLKYAFNYDRTVNSSMLEDIGEEIENWNTRKPPTFQPIQHVPRSNEAHRRFPGVWMLLPVHVVGVQYYHIAKIILAFSYCPSPSLAYESFKQSRSIEKVVRGHLLTVLGLAKSNPRAENTLFTARHSLVSWGWILRHRQDQEAAENLLRDVETRTGWDVSQSIQSLREQWCDGSDDN
ncbi:hypothetical protein BDV27DRAFT_141818 [Aspergillus caelatus]|uniref:Zn(2)-C6 fungal-type domain-containing protein n=1 Tax=Aspergillus caelatus TaxID=61420 RepID=A0A5N7AHX0_9EURO|nr:uncharacterized protein BDV27DRAFT_141818 [Aspergillus caelatus]KAE8368599.1 hypothetical protein BDV27DRAFT_141818 [Aspergillus caelatus]